MKFVCTKQGMTLRPAGVVGEGALRSIHDGDFVMVEVKQSRNLAHHQKFFALLDLVKRNQNKYQTTEDLLTAVKICTGHYDIVQLHDGKPVIAPKSISFVRSAPYCLSHWSGKLLLQRIEWGTLGSR